MSAPLHPLVRRCWRRLLPRDGEVRRWVIPGAVLDAGQPAVARALDRATEPAVAAGRALGVHLEVDLRTWLRPDTGDAHVEARFRRPTREEHHPWAK